jgi:hypothetical protein
VRQLPANIRVPELCRYTEEANSVCDDSSCEACCGLVAQYPPSCIMASGFPQVPIFSMIASCNTRKECDQSGTRTGPHWCRLCRL